MAAVLTIMTRSTSDPRIKARLAPRVPDEDGRRDLTLAILDDLVDRAGALPNVRVRLAVTPPVEALRVERPALPSETFIPQRGSSLAERQRNVLEDLAASGFTSVVMIGADLPDVPPRHLEQAFAWLSDSAPTVVMGPSDSGGCYLIGVTVTPGLVPDLFSRLRWSTPYAADDLAVAGTAAGLTLRTLDPWNNVKSPADLDLLTARLRYSPDSAPHTAAALRRLKLL